MTKISWWGVLTAGLIALVAVFSASVVWSPMVPLALVASVAGVLAFHKRPKIALVIWLMSLAFVPYWVGFNAFGYVPLASAVGAAILIGNTLRSDWRWGNGDLSIIAIIAVGFIAMVLTGSNQGVWLSMVTQWLLAYLVGKTIVAAAGIEFALKAIGSILGLVALLSIAELLLSWHPFVDLVVQNPAYDTWSSIQVRGGVDRSEWAFGHSIALGGTLSAGVAFAMRSAIGGLKKSLLLLALFAGVACTFSRAAIISAVLTLCLSVMFMKGLRPGFRIALLFIAVGAGIAGSTLIAPVFELASGETSGSSGYRERMWAELLPQLAAIGRSDSAVVSGDGSVRYGSFHSIDSTFLALGLGFGWLAAAALAIPFVFMALRVVRRAANTAEVALVGQLPLLFTVALITQYQMVLWFMAGVAVALAKKTDSEGLDKFSSKLGSLSSR